MRKLITYETLNNFAYSNDKLCNEPIKGIVLDFMGCGWQNMYDEDSDFAKELAGYNIILVTPYTNPWAFLNRQALIYTEEIVSVLMEKYSLPETLPFVSCGPSMGGYSALMYAMYTEHNIIACVADCPVCDLVYWYAERADTPRILYNAFAQSGADCLEDELKASSPVNLINDMPKIDYYIFHGDNDTDVNIEAHSGKFVKKMKAGAHKITYHVSPGRGHYDLQDDMKALYRQYVMSAILGN